MTFTLVDPKANQECDDGTDHFTTPLWRCDTCGDLLFERQKATHICDILTIEIAAERKRE